MPFAQRVNSNNTGDTCDLNSPLHFSNLEECNMLFRTCVSCHTHELTLWANRPFSNLIIYDQNLAISVVFMLY